jgi:uncharacterized protein YcfJ
MQSKTIAIALAMLCFVGGANAGQAHGHGDKRAHGPHDELYDYARVIDVQPLYREVRLREPVRECWDEPVYHTRSSGHKSAGGMLAGGLIGGIVGHQIGNGRGQRVATAVGTLIGAKIGHDAVNGHHDYDEKRVAGYEERCETRYQVSYETVVDAYDVTYKYRGKTYRMEMPYDPGERIKMRIRIEPVL